MQILDFKEKHIEEATELALANYDEERYFAAKREIMCVFEDFGSRRNIYHNGSILSTYQWRILPAEASG